MKVGPQVKFMLMISEVFKRITVLHYLCLKVAWIIILSSHLVKNNNNIFSYIPNPYIDVQKKKRINRTSVLTMGFPKAS